MTCHTHGDQTGRVCWCGAICTPTDGAAPESRHSHLGPADAVAEARRMGDPTAGDGWRRLLWRMADLMDGRSGESC